MHFEINRESFIIQHLNKLYEFQKSFVRRPRPRIKSKFENNLNLRLAAQNITVKLGQNLETYMYQPPVIEDLEDTITESAYMERTPRRDATDAKDFSEGERTPYRKNTLINNVASTIEENTPNREKDPVKRVKHKDSKKHNKVGLTEVGIDKVYTYKYYFPHNNIGAIVTKINEKVIKLLRKNTRAKSPRRPHSMIYDKPKSCIGDELEDRGYIKSTHDYGVGSIDFASEVSDQDLNENTYSDTISLQQTTECVGVSDEDSKANAETSPEVQARKLDPKKPSLSPLTMSNVVIAQNFIHGDNTSTNPKIKLSSQQEIRDSVDNEKDATMLLKQIISKYGMSYVQKVLHEKASREVQIL